MRLVRQMHTERVIAECISGGVLQCLVSTEAEEITGGGSRDVRLRREFISEMEMILWMERPTFTEPISGIRRVYLEF